MYVDIAYYTFFKYQFFYSFLPFHFSFRFLKEKRSIAFNNYLKTSFFLRFLFSSLCPPFILLFFYRILPSFSPLPTRFKALSLIIYFPSLCSNNEHSKFFQCSSASHSSSFPTAEPSDFFLFSSPLFTFPLSTQKRKTHTTPFSFFQ